MLYFTARADESELTALMTSETELLETYMAVCRFINQNQLHTFPIDVLPPAKLQEYISLSEQYRSQRNIINRRIPIAARISKRYGVADVTPTFLEATTLPDYGDGHPNVFGKSDYDLWQDCMQQMLGHIELAKKQEFRRLCNPFNWFYLPLLRLFRAPMELIGKSGTAFGKFWETLSSLLAGVAVLALILFILFWFFGVPSDRIRDILMKRLEGGK
jgi:hypothetical protein